MTSGILRPCLVWPGVASQDKLLRLVLEAGHKYGEGVIKEAVVLAAAGGAWVRQGLVQVGVLGSGGGSSGAREVLGAPGPRRGAHECLVLAHVLRGGEHGERGAGNS